MTVAVKCIYYFIGYIQKQQREFYMIDEEQVKVQDYKQQH